MIDDGFNAAQEQLWRAGPTEDFARRNRVRMRTLTLAQLLYCATEQCQACAGGH